MRRREFIASVAALGAWSASVRAQQPQRLRKLAIIMAAGKTPEYVAAVAALEQALGSLGWKNGENLQIDERWSAGSEDGARSAAREIVASNPDIILGQSAAVIEALQSRPGRPRSFFCMLPTRLFTASYRTWRDLKAT